jgi:hypothetical protein
MPDELNSFLKDLGVPDESILDKPLDGTDEEPEKETPVRKVELDDDGYARNRQGRRKREADQRMRDEVLQLNERVKVLSEVGKFREEVGDDELRKVEAIFGTDTPEKLAATNILKEALSGLTERAKKETLRELDSRQEEELGAQEEADDEVDEFLDIAEEEGLDTEDDNTRKGLITLMERMSSKYNDGNIKEFADSEAVIETYKELQKRQGSSKARELASRSMTHSGESQSSKLPQNAIERYMEENGLTGSW